MLADEALFKSAMLVQQLLESIVDARRNNSGFLTILVC